MLAGELACLQAWFCARACMHFPLFLSWKLSIADGSVHRTQSRCRRLASAGSSRCVIMMHHRDELQPVAPLWPPALDHLCIRRIAAVWHTFKFQSTSSGSVAPRLRVLPLPVMLFVLSARRIGLPRCTATRQIRLKPGTRGFLMLFSAPPAQPAAAVALPAVCVAVPSAWIVTFASYCRPRKFHVMI